MPITAPFAATLLAAAMALHAPAASAGTYLEHEAVLPNPADLSKSIKQVLHSWQDGRRFKRESPLRGEVVIIDLDKKAVFGVNESRRTYWKLSTERYQRLALMSLVVMGVQLGLDGNPVVPDPMFTPTGNKALIDERWHAQEMKITAALPPGVATSIWVSSDVSLPLAQLVSQMRVSLADPKGAAYETLYRQWSSLPGYPVQNVTTVQTPNGLVTTSETLLTFREMKIEPSVFEVPKGFALVTDPLTELEQRMQAGGGAPAGIGAPLKPPAPPTGAPK
ncbi:MAG: hypothetical protein A2138_27470 [Deltaproteobacteria bacterium RBG_16_71_12]|nr:MAG: hypothetical protein A2138_27470 [Deltaproteobacteria bacterium RBG_16_71_12]